MAPNTTSVDEYIKSFPPDVQKLLEQLRSVIQKSAPDAEEKISYGIPTYNLYGPLVHFGAFANHIGFYATPSGHQEFQEELSNYKQGNGSVQFPIDEPLPVKLIAQMVRFRAEENKRKAELKGA
jgi:uncharacterized protein YdhG (YjbR/CyaY superfamily)